MELTAPLSPPMAGNADGGGKDESDGEEEEQAMQVPVEREVRATPYPSYELCS